MAEKIKFKTNIPDGYFENGIMEANEVNEKFNQAFDQIKVFYMFMYEDKKFMHFIHILYRDYIKIRKEEIKRWMY